MTASTLTAAEREAARQSVISQGGAYYARLLAEHGVKTFSELPDDVLTRLAATRRTNSSSRVAVGA